MSNSYEYTATVLCSQRDVAILQDALYYPSRAVPAATSHICQVRLTLDIDSEDVPVVALVLALYGDEHDIDAVIQPNRPELPLFVFTANSGTVAVGIYGDNARLVESDSEHDPYKTCLVRAVLDALAGEGGA